MAIIVSKGSKNAQRVERTVISQEVDLQSYIHDNPESIPLNEIQSDLRLLILAREFPTSSGPIDALGIDQEGSIYLIETKLARNPDKRLVLAQVLDYGAALWRSNEDGTEFINKLESFVSRTFGVPLIEKVQDFYGLEVETVTVLVQTMRQNLRDGKFRFVVLMDYLSDRLRDLITFVNQNSRFDIFGVELEFYKFQEYEILIPKLYGAEIKKQVGSPTPGSARRTWDEDTFFQQAMEQLPAHVVTSLRELYSFSKRYANDIAWGSGLQTGSFNPKFNIVHPTKSLYTVWSSGILDLNFKWLTDTQSAAIAESVGRELQQVPNLSIPQNYGERFVRLKAEQWSSQTSAIIRVFQHILQLQ